MYAYIPEIGGGFFEGACTLSSATAIFRDPPVDLRIDPGDML
jgi:hypothetical protein